ncbi:hypothetical protein ACFO7E_29595 [Cupriavidus pampae]
MTELARYYDTPSLHAQMVAEARDALDAWLALLVAEDPPSVDDMESAKRLVVGRLFTLCSLVDFPESSEVRQWMESLAAVGLLSGLELSGPE